MQPYLAYFFLNSHFDLTDVTCFSWIFICIEASIFPIALFILFSSLFSQIISFFSRQSFDYYFYHSATSLNNNYSLRICTVYFPSKRTRRLTHSLALPLKRNKSHSILPDCLDVFIYHLALISLSLSALYTKRLTVIGLRGKKRKNKQTNKRPQVAHSVMDRASPF